ncbi:MAG: trypsin-like peptidase domain-containing protein [Candidatus Omnitrophica bacterium]|nr:trypsin-like peptidase domain-containing protein [Candidatus Omnitrophota bacterium]
MNIKRLIFVLLILSLCRNGYTQTSVLESILHSKKSIVDITARITNVFQNPKASAAINPQTGKLLVARQKLVGRHDRTGAGVIISKDGLIVTNLHTVKFAQKIAVRLYSGEVLAAKVLHISPEDDLALLKINPPDELIPIRFFDSNKVRLGDEIINIGHSTFLKNTASGGRVTRLAFKTIEEKKEIELIQVNITLYEGDSGGPVLNKEGDLVGIIAAKFRNTQKATLAIPSNKIKKLYIDYIK